MVCSAAWSIGLSADEPAVEPGREHATIRRATPTSKLAPARMKATRPTAVNLAWAIERQLTGMAKAKTAREKIELALRTAREIAAEDEENCRMIGQHGLNLIEEVARAKNGKPVNILTHCNAGWLAFVDYGSALAPVYGAHDRNLPVHVWVDETRPRSQVSKLTD